MSTGLDAIPLDGAPDDDDLLLLLPPAGRAAVKQAEPGLAMQQMGLLAAPRPALDDDRRMEDWIASQIDLSLSIESPRTEKTIWNQLIDRLPALRRGPHRRVPRGGAETAFADWSRFRIAYRRGITVVRLIDRALVKERDVRELTCDLIELIEAGNHRIVLNFDGVERLASWVALAIDEAYRRASAGDGGELRICGLAAPLARVLDIAGMAPGIAIHPDEVSALDDPWPEPATPRTLPVDILMALTRHHEPPPLSGGAPSGLVGSEPERSQPSRGRHERHAPASPGVWLVVQMGATRGRPVPVSGPRFVIGRQRECQLRLNSPMVSKIHAAIERRENHLFLCDLGSTNGTILNGRLLRGKEAEIHDGDRIQIGPVVCTVATVAHREGSLKVEEKVAEWLHGQAPDQPEGINALDTAVLATSSAASDDANAEVSIRTEVIQDVLVVTPEVGELESDATIELLRVHLHSLLGQPVPRRVVVNLEYVAHLTGQAIGVLLAHHLRLDRTGGGLRICQARARIMAVLHQVRLTMLVECHPTLDEAVLAAWPVVAGKGPGGR